MHTLSHTLRPCIKFTKNRVNSVPPVVYFRNAQRIKISVQIRSNICFLFQLLTLNCKYVKKKKTFFTRILSLAEREEVTQHLPTLWLQPNTHKYFSHRACAREHLHLYLYGSGFSSKVYNYIIIEFCSAAYQRPALVREAFEEFGPALAHSLPSSPPLHHPLRHCL